MHVEPRSLKNCNQANFLTCFSSGLTPSIDTGVAILFQEEFSQPSLLMPIASHPLIEQGEGGAKIQESAAYKNKTQAVLYAKTSEDPNNPEDRKQNA